MKPSPRDYLTIAAALIAILLCGYGIGFLVGERTTQKRLQPNDNPPPSERPWEQVTLDRLVDELNLTDAQKKNVAEEINTSAAVILRARMEASAIYEKEVLDLHQRLLPFLDEKQRKRIEESNRRLQELLDESS